MSGATKRWPTPWSARSFDEGRLRQWPDGIRLWAAQVIMFRPPVFTWKVWADDGIATAHSIVSGDCASEAEAMAAADEALFQHVCGVGAWTFHNDLWKREPVNGRVYPMVHAAPSIWRIYRAPNVEGMGGKEVGFDANRAAADKALLALVTSQQAPVTEAPPAPPPPTVVVSDATDAPLSRDDFDAQWDVGRARLVLQQAALGFDVGTDRLNVSRATLREYGQIATVDAFDRDRNAYLDREKKALADMEEAVARRQAEGRIVGLGGAMNLDESESF